MSSVATSESFSGERDGGGRREGVACLEPEQATPKPLSSVRPYSVVDVEGCVRALSRGLPADDKHGFDALITSALADELRGIGARRIAEPLLTAGEIGLVDLQTALTAFLQERRSVAERIKFLDVGDIDSCREFRLTALPPVGSQLFWLDGDALGGAFRIRRGLRLAVQLSGAALIQDGEPFETFEGDLGGRPIEHLTDDILLAGKGYVLQRYEKARASARWCFDVPYVMLDLAVGSGRPPMP